MTMSFDIIRGKPQHASTLTEVTVAAKRHWNYPEKWMQIWLPALTISPEYISEHETWIAVMDDLVVAYYSLKSHPARNDGEELWLDNLWVLPEYIGRGIGKSLFEHALEKSRARGASLLKIEADPNAVSFYERMGAWRVSEHHSEVDGETRILPVMEINL